MAILNIRKGNTINVAFTIYQGENPMDLTNATNFKVTVNLVSTNCVQLTPTNVNTSSNPITFDISGSATSCVPEGLYSATITFQLNGEQFAVDAKLFKLVPHSWLQGYGSECGCNSNTITNNCGVEITSVQVHGCTFYQNGKDGTSIVSVEVRSTDGHLLVTLSDESIIDAGTVWQDGYVTEAQLQLAIQNVFTAINGNTSDIEVLQLTVASLQEQLNERTHFRGSFTTTAGVLAITNPTEGDFAYNLQTLTQWNYEGGQWIDTTVGIPTTTFVLSDALPLPNGEASPGNASEGSRWDHIHPSDPSKQDVLTEGTNIDITNNVISATIPDTVVQYDINGNIIYRPNTKFVMSTTGTVAHEAFGINHYTDSFGAFDQTEVGSQGALWNGNIQYDEDRTKGYPTWDIYNPDGTFREKQYGVYRKDLNEYKKFYELPSKFVDGQFIGITFAELQNLSQKEQDGYLPYADGINFTSYKISDNGASITLQYAYDYINVQPLNGYTELHGYIVTIQASSANVIVTPIEVMMPRISEVPYHLPNSFVTPDTTLNTLPDVTWQQIQEAYRQYLLGRDFTSNIASLYGVTQFIVTNDLASLQYDFSKVTNNELVRYHASINATEQNVVSSVIPTDYDQLISELKWTGISGSITASGQTIQLPLANTGLIIHLAYRDADIFNFYLISQSGTVTADVKRAAIYGSSPQGSQFDGFSFGNTPDSTNLIDDIQNKSQDWVITWVRVFSVWYEIKIFASGSGQRITVAYQKII